MVYSVRIGPLQPQNLPFSTTLAEPATIRIENFVFQSNANGKYDRNSFRITLLSARDRRQTTICHRFMETQAKLDLSVDRLRPRGSFRTLQHLVQCSAIKLFAGQE